jgi:hypothetical protein
MALLIFFTVHSVLSQVMAYFADRDFKNVCEGIDQATEYGSQMQLMDVVRLINVSAEKKAVNTHVGIVGLGWSYAFARWMGWI